VKARSFQVGSSDQITDELITATADGFTPTIACIFMSVGPGIASVRAPFEDRGIQIFGSHTYGEFTGQQVAEGTISVLLMDLAKEAFYIEPRVLQKGAEDEVARELTNHALEHFSNPVFFLVCSHLETIAEDLIAGIESILGPEIDVFGAMSGMDIETQEHAVFTNGAALDRGVVAMIFDGDRVSVEGVATCGWKPVGSIKTVTKSDGTWVHEIDDQPALDLMIKYSGACTKEQLTPEFWVEEFAMSLPPQLIREEGASVMRPSLMYDLESSSVMCNGRVPQGSKIRFSLPPEDDVIDAVIDAARELKETRAPEADAILYFSCAGRIMSLGPMMKREISSVQKLWDVPLAGFFSAGEIARATGGRNELNNITSSCVVLKEK